MLHKNNWPELGEQSTPASNVQPTVARTEQQWVGKSNLMKTKRKSHIIYLQTSDSHQFRDFHLFSWKNSDHEYVLEIKIQMWSEFQKEKNPKTKLKEKARKHSKSYWVIQLLHETLTFSCSIIFSLFWFWKIQEVENGKMCQESRSCEPQLPSHCASPLPGTLPITSSTACSGRLNLSVTEGFLRRNEIFSWLPVGRPGRAAARQAQGKWW